MAISNPALDCWRGRRGNDFLDKAMKKAITDFTIGAVAMLSVVGLYSAVDLWQRTGMDCPKLKPGHAVIALKDKDGHLERYCIKRKP